MRTGPLGIDARTATSYTEACATPQHRIQSTDSRRRTDPDAAGRAGGREGTGRSKLSVAWVPLLASTTSSSQRTGGSPGSVRRLYITVYSVGTSAVRLAWRRGDLDWQSTEAGAGEAERTRLAGGSHVTSSESSLRLPARRSCRGVPARSGSVRQGTAVCGRSV